MLRQPNLSKTDFNAMLFERMDSDHQPGVPGDSVDCSTEQGIKRFQTDRCKPQTIVRPSLPCER